MNVAAIVLAAGGSSRFGAPKQLIQINGESLVALAVKRCLQAGCTTVVVVTGRAAEEVVASIAHLSAFPVHNSDWRSGQASSIVAGIRALLDWASNDRIAMPDAVLITLCDTPKITAKDLGPFVNCKSRNASIVATKYSEGGGVPACFSWSLHTDLLLLSGDHGAKELIRSSRYPVELCDLPNAQTDIDSPLDWREMDPKFANQH